ncbi:LysR family transcriptional regulator [Eggerthia catenaformis]|uniref:LysR family transcriptional regulator n=1 Tax=Eggerthia catenaformis TaxID=31973 RepID=UPI00248ECEAD|nr:LysR family transcriptional regulator [Eggerthia catenaformis]
MNIKLDHYKIFNEAASSLSFSKAANHLYITQSAVSQAVTQLEKQLDTVLFIRHAKGVSLTKEGLMMHEKIKNALDLISSAENELTNMKELKSGELVIGTGDTLCQNYLMKYLVKFQKLYPHVHIKVVNGTSFETVSLLKNRFIDLAFVNMPIDDEQITSIPCFKVHDIFVSGTKDNHLYSYKELAQKKLIMLESLSNSRKYVDECFKKEGISLLPEMELGAHELLKVFASYQMGISCVIKEFSEDCLNKSIFELKINPPIPSREIGYAYLSSLSLPLAANKFIELIHNT